MANLNIFKHAAVDKLKGEIDDHLDRYASGDIAGVIRPHEYQRREVAIEIGDCGGIKLPVPNGPNGDLENCLFMQRVYGNLTPRQAVDGRVWAYATHVMFSDYVHKRWPVPSEMKPEERGAKDGAERFHERKIRHVKVHYFADSNREFVRDNAISRLWWMGFIAKRCKEFTPERTLGILLKKSDVRANILERPNLNMSAEIFNEIIYLLDEDMDGPDSDETTLFYRENFRNFMKIINRTGGMRILNALPQDALKKLLGDIKRRVIAGAE